MIHLHAAGGRLLLKFQTDIIFVDYFLEILKAVLAYQGLDDSTNLLLVSKELLKNAVVHGNRNDPGKTVLYRLVQLAERRYRVEAEDCGEGFDFRKICGQPANALDDQMEQRHGFRIIRALSESVEFKKGGSKVEVLLEA